MIIVNGLGEVRVQLN